VNVSPCPDPERLRTLLDVEAAGRDADPLVRHVGECPACQEALERLAVGDPQLARLVSTCARSRPEPDSAFWPALHDLERLASRSTPPPTTTPAPHSDPNTTAFLDPDTRETTAGLRIGPFEVVREIGRGGMGVVYLARDPQLHRDVAIKVLDKRLAGDPVARERFCREAKAAAGVGDDHIVAVHQVSGGGDGTPPYFVMQFVEGESLEDRLARETRLPIDEIVRIGMQVAAGLAAAHDKGLIHRDVKPGNILLEKGTDRVKLTDFGLAHAAQDVRLTSTGMVAGTPLYMSPEQARAEPLDARADLFSLGIVLYEMATGALPFPGNTPYLVLRRLSEERHKPVAELNPAVPEWLAAVIDKLLAKRPEDRYQSAREVAELLEQHWLLRRTSSQDHVVCPRARVRRKMLQLAAMGVAAGVVLTLAGLWVWSLIQPALPGPVTPWRTLDGNQGPIWCVAGSPIEDVLAVGTHSEGVKLWNPAENRVEGVLPETRPILAVAYSADGKKLAVGTEDNTLRVYDLATRDLKHRLTHASAVRAVAFSGDGRKAVTGTRGGMVALWDLDTGKEIGEPVAAHGSVASVAFSPDDRDFATAGEDGRAILWDAAMRRPRFETPAQEGGTWSVRFTPDGKTFATGGWDGTVRLWDAGTGKLQGDMKVTGPGKDLIAMSFCPSGKLLAIACADQSIRLWNVPQRQERAVLRGHTGAVTSVVIARDGRNLASGSRDGTVHMWAIPPVCYE